MKKLIECPNDFDQNFDHHMLMVASTHPELHVGEDGDLCNILLCNVEEDTGRVLVKALACEGCGYEETVGFAMRELCIDFTRQTPNAVMKDCYNENIIASDEPENKMIKHEQYFLFDNADDAHAFLCDVQSPKYNRNYV